MEGIRNIKYLCTGTHEFFFVGHAGSIGALTETCYKATVVWSQSSLRDFFGKLFFSFSKAKQNKTKQSFTTANSAKTLNKKKPQQALFVNNEHKFRKTIFGCFFSAFVE